MTTRSLILFPHEIRAALRGELGLVVRPVKPQPEYQDATGRWTFCVSSTDKKDDDKFSYCVIDGDGYHYTERGRERVVLSLRDPFGFPGTRLCCRETWRVGAWREPGFNVRSRFAIDYQASPEITKTPWIEVDDGSWATELRCHVFKELVGKGLTPPFIWEPGKGALSWRSPATMPAWASRITLEVEGVRVCRVSELTEDEAESMSFHRQEPECYHTNCDDRYWATGSFATHWDSIYAAKGLGWNQSPWVWAVNVRRVD